MNDHRRTYWLQADIVSGNELSPDDLTKLIEDLLEDNPDTVIYSAAVFDVAKKKEEEA